MRLPRWIVSYNIVSPENGEFVGTGAEFFYDEMDATNAYVRLTRAGNCCTVRPFCEEVDRRHMGVVHQLWYQELAVPR